MAERTTPVEPAGPVLFKPCGKQSRYSKAHLNSLMAVFKDDFPSLFGRCELPSQDLSINACTNIPNPVGFGILNA